MDVRAGQYKSLSTKELIYLNCDESPCESQGTLERPLGSKEIKSVNPKGNQP